MGREGQLREGVRFQVAMSRLYREPHTPRRSNGNTVRNGLFLSTRRQVAQLLAARFSTTTYHRTTSIAFCLVPLSICNFLMMNRRARTSRPDGSPGTTGSLRERELPWSP